MMPTTLAALRLDLERAMHFFKTDDAVRALPFMHSFPRNCCEVACAVLAKVLSDKYNDAKVVVVCGTIHASASHHYWIEVGDTVVDPTTSQFEDMPQALVCDKPSPLAETFLPDEYQKPDAALSSILDMDIDPHLLRHVLSSLAAQLG